MKRNIAKFISCIVRKATIPDEYISWEQNVMNDNTMNILDHPAMINYNKTKLTEQCTSGDRQRKLKWS